MRHSRRFYIRLGAGLGVLLLLLVVWQAVIQADPGDAPILLVVNDDYSPTHFGRYLGEILRAEGLNSFDVMDISSLDAAELTGHDLTILAETSLTSAQAAMLNTYVSGGGRLLAMRPDEQIGGLFGLGASAGVLSNGYVQIDTAALLNGVAPGQGLTSATLQIHGDADEYSTLAGAVSLAQLYSDASSPTSYPAVVGDGTGRAVAFTYDLAQNVIYTRQGNPANANLDVDNDGVTRTVDLFMPSGGGAPWVDRDKIPLPQADIQQRLFARLVRQLVAEARPLPQLWYFPGTTKTMLILTGDAHGNPTSYYQDEIDSIDAYNGKITIYFAFGDGPPNATVQGWRTQGHEFGIHPYAYQPYEPNLAQGYSDSDLNFGHNYASPKSRTVRNHQVAWLGWTDAADLAAAYGIAMETNFYHWGEWLQKPDNSWPHGYITGSGQPMKFMRADGTLVPVYQQLTELVDEQLLGSSSPESLTSQQAVAVSQQLIDASQAGDYAALMTQFHVDIYSSTHTWAEGTMDYARSHDIPIWNADQWLSFTETRHDAAYSDIVWTDANKTLTFNLSATATTGINLTTIVPLSYAGNGLQSVSVDGQPVAYSVQTISSVDVAFVTVPAGNHTFTALYEEGTPAPTPTPTATPSSGSVTHTSYNDFGQSCAVLTDTHVSDVDGGAVALAATFADDFTGTTLDPSRWSSGSWGGGSYTPIMNSGVLTLPGGGWVRSSTTYTHGVIEAIAEFGPGVWQHIGFASDGFANDGYFLLSTYNTNNTLYARVNNNSGEQNVSLGSLPTGLHRYRIEWSGLDASTDRVQFYLDGTLRAQMDVTNVGATNWYAYLSNNGAADLNVDAAQVAPPYTAEGSYTSCVLDAGVDVVWQIISWDASVPSATNLAVQVRTSPDGSTWNEWQDPPTSSGSSISPFDRYAQYRLYLATSDDQTAPVVNSVTLRYGPMPTAVELAWFRTSSHEGVTVVEWETATELHNLGFNLYRTDAPNVLPGRGERLNEALIPSQSPGDLWGASYAYSDETAAADTTYYYWLEAIDNKGVAKLYGPVTAVVEIDTTILPDKTYLPIVFK
jgi:hypothetical protein